MDKWEKERRKQHEPHGLTDTGNISKLRLMKTLWKCECGWAGWFPIRAE